MKLLTLLLLLFLNQDDVPFKPNEEFELKLELQFKSRPSETAIYPDKPVGNSTGPLPYLSLNLKLVKLGVDEKRVRVIRSGDQNIISKKTEPDMLIKLDLGFTDDIKDRVTASQYTITFLSQDKKPISRIEIFFEKDGSYFVNGEKRGKV